MFVCSARSWCLLQTCRQQQLSYSPYLVEVGVGPSWSECEVGCSGCVQSEPDATLQSVSILSQLYKEKPTSDVFYYLIGFIAGQW
jgi:hypothetical protein